MTKAEIVTQLSRALNRMNRFTAIALTGALVVFSTLAMAADAPMQIVMNPPKFPVPGTVSPEAQAILGRPIPDLSSIPLAQTRDEWMASKEFVATRYGAALPKLLQSLPIELEKASMGGVTVRVITPDNLAPEKSGKVLMNVHGGAYVHFGGDYSVLEALQMATASGYRVVAVDYRMPPDHPYPAAVDDTVAVYRDLLKNYQPEDIVIFGTSAGGSLTASTILAARDQGLPLPAGAIMNSPWSDLSKTGDSYFTNEGVDPKLSTYDGRLEASARLYAGEEDLRHPLVSPVYADYSPGFPPSMLISGTRDLLLSCTVRLHRKLRAAGIPAELHIFEAMWHGFSQVPELDEAQSEMNLFLERHLGGRTPG